MMTVLFFALLAPDSPAATVERPRPCTQGARGNIHPTYKPYGNAVFGSDGLACPPIKSKAEQAAKGGTKAAPVNPWRAPAKEGSALPER